jgi:hypothetical protein
MVDVFQKILFTSVTKRFKLSDDQNKKKAQKLPKTEEYSFIYPERIRKTKL